MKKSFSNFKIEKLPLQHLKLNAQTYVDGTTPLGTIQL